MGGMWTKEHRARQAAFERRCYPTDLTDAEWERIRALLPEPAKRGRKPGVDLREILNAIRYLARPGCGWWMLPASCGPWQTVPTGRSLAKKCSTMRRTSGSVRMYSGARPPGITRAP